MDDVTQLLVLRILVRIPIRGVPHRLRRDVPLLRRVPWLQVPTPHTQPFRNKEGKNGRRRRALTTLLDQGGCTPVPRLEARIPCFVRFPMLWRGVLVTRWEGGERGWRREAGRQGTEGTYDRWCISILGRLRTGCVALWGVRTVGVEAGGKRTGKGKERKEDVQKRYEAEFKPRPRLCRLSTGIRQGINDGTCYQVETRRGTYNHTRVMTIRTNPRWSRIILFHLFRHTRVSYLGSSIVSRR